MRNFVFRIQAIGLLSGSIHNSRHPRGRRGRSAKTVPILERFLFIVFALLSLVSMVQANTITAVSCSSTDVHNAIEAAVAGDTVAIPAGICSWTSGVSWTAPANVTLQGAGISVVGGGDQTVIIDNYATNSPLLEITVSSSGKFRMTGMTVRSGPSGANKDEGMITFHGPGNVELDHLHIDTLTNFKTQYKTLYIGNTVYGVLHSSILDLYSTNAIYVFNGTGTDGQGNAAWAAATNFGSSDFFFIEDNIVNGSPSTYNTRLVDCYVGGRHVIRFNNFTASSTGETHATGHDGSTGNNRGCRAQEIYGNYSVLGSGQSQPNYDLAEVGNGAALLWGNQAGAGAYKNIFIFNVTRKNNTTYPQATNGWGYCGTDFTGTGSAWDQSSSSGTGYACLDQPGRGQGQLLSGSHPNKINTFTGTIAWPNQVLEPIYIWKNIGTYTSGWGGTYYLNNSGTASGYRVQSDRDYYQQASNIQTSSTSPFNGSSGTGWGTLANRPTTCTTGVGYFATDQGSWNTSTSNPYGVQQNGADGVLYKCTSTNTWTSYYTPYTYPHPLRQAQRAVDGPDVVKNVHIQQN
jgi:hypothetical protein